MGNVIHAVVTSAVSSGIISATVVGIDHEGIRITVNKGPVDIEVCMEGIIARSESKYGPCEI